LTKDEALILFGANPFKVALISNKISDGASVTAYRSGDLIDLCTGPHVPSTENIKAFKVLKNSSSNWLSNTKNDSLQRIYGVSFPSKKELDEHIHLLEEAKKRDHRTIGRAQGLFDMNELSPGCAFQYPMGTIIYNKLVDMIKQ
jgi:threonyl-tRNA synthetase